MMRITDLRLLQRVTESYVLYLFDTTGARLLQMFVGPYEGLHLQQLLECATPAQTTSYHHLNSILDALGVKLEAVRIDAVQQSIEWGNCS